MNSRLAFSTYFVRTWMMPNILGKIVPQAKIIEAKKHVEVTLDLLTNVWLKDSPFIAGDEITVADLVAATEIEQLGELSELELNLPNEVNISTHT